MIEPSEASSTLPAASVGAVFDRYRDAIHGTLQQCLAGRELDFYEMLRYQLGLDSQAPKGGQGKALRPMLCLLTCDALGGAWVQALPAAACLELIHNFSLIHDDIQDGDRERRHRPTVWTRWGIPQGINAGDAMFSLATLTLVDLRANFDDSAIVEVMKAIQEAVGEMIEGQYLDVSFESQQEISLDQYLHMIGCKTGALLRASIEVGAMLSDAGMPIRHRCRRFGEAVGRLFQIRDDMLGVWGKSESTGKPVDSDIRRRKKSLPIVMALSRATGSERDELLEIYGSPRLADTDVQRVLAIFDRLNVEEHVHSLAQESYEQAKSLAEAINFSDRGRVEIENLVEFLLDREH